MQLSDTVGIQPRTFAGVANELDQALDSPVADDLRQMGSMLRQDVDEMSQAHQEVIALHGGPVFREAMLILIAMTLFYEDVALDRPSVTGDEITPLMHIVAVQRVTGNPGMA